jgi:hypothetical protein
MLFVRAEVDKDTLFLGLNKRVGCLSNSLDNILLFLGVLLELLVDDQTIGREFLPLFQNDHIAYFQVLPKVIGESSFFPHSRVFCLAQCVGLTTCFEEFPDHAVVELVGDLLLARVNGEFDSCPTNQLEK